MTDSTGPAPRRAIAPEADWDTAKALFDGGDGLVLSAEQCGIEYWFDNVPQGTLRGNVLGHAPDVVTPQLVLDEGPLHEALIREVAFRTLAEERAAASLSYLVLDAPNLACMEFYATQLIDETRHAMIFRRHLVGLGAATPDTVQDVIDELVGDDRQRILTPLENYVLPIIRDEHDFIGAVVLLTTLVEGVLAPSFEQSERKWRPLDPVMADIQKGAGIDEVRHLAVGSSLVRAHLEQHPKDTDRLVEIVRNGMHLFYELPVIEQLSGWEALYQEGIAQHADLLADYEIWPGHKLLDSTPEERIGKTFEMTARIHESRLTDMGLAAALT
ncbi:VlmB-like protein [Yinghuangia seranimata]|uniref:VlmB-like protein n=1 Tax=Yinghuangia seranimata TaxID=408067 RepID=UPI00248B650E|nr:VlmB-like protein [Yinghuangia seranimata]MDI2130933.1 VlmB-like protein [Yinghuangia seranimata]